MPRTVRAIEAGLVYHADRTRARFGLQGKRHAIVHDGQNMVAEYVDNGGTLTLRRSYVHGLQYIDERAVMRDHEGDGQDYYYLLQELYSVSGLATSNGLRAEHAVYDAYGQATLYAWPAADVNGDGTVNIFDQVAVRDALNTISPLQDVNLDGAVDIFDLVTVRGQLDTSAVATTTSNVGNPYYFTGRLTDTLHASDLLVANDPHFRRLQDNRNRTYDPKHGRWLQRDPLGTRPETPGGGIRPAKQYTDGMSVYEYVRSSSLTYVDYMGMSGISMPQLATGTSSTLADALRKRCIAQFKYIGKPEGCKGLNGPTQCPEMYRRMAANALAAANRMATAIFCYPDYGLSADPEKYNEWLGHWQQAENRKRAMMTCWEKIKLHCCPNCPPPQVVPQVQVRKNLPLLDPAPVYVLPLNAKDLWSGVCHAGRAVGTVVGRACSRCVQTFVFIPTALLDPLDSTCEPGNPNYPGCLIR